MPLPSKEVYFNSELLDAQAQELLQAPGIVFHKATPLFNPSQAALLVLDMQLYFLDKASHAYIPSAPAIIAGVSKLVRGFYARNLPVFFTRHTNTPHNAGSMSKWWKDLINPDDPHSRLISQLDFSRGITFEKSQYDAFYDTPLDAHLRILQVTQVVISGVMTHLCCETTARSAFMLGYQPFFLVDGTATYNRYFHTATLTNLSHGFATLCLVDDILRGLEPA